LYAAYQCSRHNDQTKNETSEDDEIQQYKNFLCQSNVGK
jgi:hypothetical protein